MVGFFILNYKDSERTISLAKKVSDLNEVDFVFIFDNSCDRNEMTKFKTLLPNSSKIKVYFSETNLGYNKGVTIGLKMCSFMKPDYMFVANSDVDFDNSVLQKLINRIKTHSNIGVVSCGMIEKNKIVQNYYAFPNLKYICTSLSGLGHFIKNFKVEMNEIEKNVYVVDFVRNSLVLLDYNACEEVDFFDEDLFMYFGESSLSKKLAKIGYKECIDLNINYYHNHVSSYKSKLNSKVRYFNDAKVYLKKYENLSLVKKLILTVCFGIGYVSFFFLRKLSK